MTAYARTAIVLGMKGHEHTDWVARPNARGAMTGGTGHISAFTAHIVMTMHAVDAPMIRMGEHHAHAFGRTARNFKRLLDNSGHFPHVPRPCWRTAQHGQRQSHHEHWQIFHNSSPRIGITSYNISKNTSTVTIFFARQTTGSLCFQHPVFGHALRKTSSSDMESKATLRFSWSSSHTSRMAQTQQRSQDSGQSRQTASSMPPSMALRILPRVTSCGRCTKICPPRAPRTLAVIPAARSCLNICSMNCALMPVCVESQLEETGMSFFLFAIQNKILAAYLVLAESFIKSPDRLKAYQIIPIYII